MEILSFLITLATLPVFLILIFVYNKDKNKEPLSLLLELFGFGILSVFLVYAISVGLEHFIPFLEKDVEIMNFPEILIYSFIIVALVEEFCKWIFVYKFGYKSKDYDEKYDIIVYSVFVSLGFAFLENLLYVIGDLSIGLGIVRGLLSVPAHACNAIFMGYFLSLANLYSKQDDKENAKKNIILSILIPTLLHGIFDFCLMSNIRIMIVVFFGFVIFLYTVSLKKLDEVAQKSKIEKRNKFCTNCGKIIQGNYCGNCGTKQV